MPGPFSPSLAADLSKAMVWEKLQQANFKLNGIKKLDQSVVSLSIELDSILAESSGTLNSGTN